MTRVVLIRHGETLWNQQGRMQGQQDSPLTPLGISQARMLAARMKGMDFTTLYSSDLGRAHQTARCIADETGHDIMIDGRLRERSFGIFEGLTNAEIAVRYPEDSALFSKRDPDYAMQGGESARDFQARCIECLDEISHRHAGTTIAVVSHGLVLDALYRAAMRMGLAEPRGFPLLNCSINTFHRTTDCWQALEVGDVSHLSADAVTRFDGTAV